MSDNESDIIPAGIQIVCSRKNHNKTGADRRGDAIIDPVHQKFYEALSTSRVEDKKAGRKSTPMFRVQLVHWDEEGNQKITGITYQTLAPDQVTIIHDIMQTRLSPPKPKGRVGANKDTPPADGAGAAGADGTDVNGSEADDAAAAAAAGGDDAGDAGDAEAKAAEEKKAAEKAAADKKAADKKTADKKVADDRAAADKKKDAPPPAANGAGKSAADKAREAAAGAEKKAQEVTTKADEKKAADASGDEFAHLFDE